MGTVILAVLVLVVLWRVWRLERALAAMRDQLAAPMARQARVAAVRDGLEAVKTGRALLRERLAARQRQA
jgi:hypothetical protein